MDNTMKDTGKYRRLALMIATSSIAMFALMYLNTYEFSHVRWSETRFYMTVIMGAAMTVVMLCFMLNMYSNRLINVGIFCGSAAAFLLALWFVRSQATIEDHSWMSAMIPHHSIAILTSERADIDDMRVRKLADSIVKAQRREIMEMDWLIKDIAKNGKATTDAEAASRPVPDFKAGS